MLINLIDGKSYIGQTIDLYRRFDEHISHSKSKRKEFKKSKLYNAIRKYKLKNFQFYILPIVKYGQNIANEEEKRLIKKYNTFSKDGECDGYNMTEGGFAVGSGINHPNHGKHPSEETLRLQSIAQSGENNPMYGKTHSDEYKQRLRIEMSGENNPMYGVPSPGKGKPGPHRGKFGKDCPISKMWEIEHIGGLIEQVHGLKKYADDNGYNQGLLSAVYHGNAKRHKDIIRVTKLPNDYLIP